MKKLSLLFLVLLFSSCGTVQERSSLVFLQKESSFYKRGYEEGFKRGVLKGKMEVWEKVKKNLKLWERDVLSLEAGKVALERGYVTQPVLFREKDGAVVSKPVLVLSKVEELLKLFIPTYQQRQNREEEKGKAEETSFYGSSSLPVWAKVPFKEGFEKGYEEGLKEGRKEGVEEVKEFERGSLFRNFFLKEEKEKYYVKDYLITYPRLYKVVEGNKVRIVIIPPQVEGIRKSLLTLKVPTPEREVKEGYGGIVLPATSSPYYFYGSSPSLKRVEVSCSQELSKWGVPFVEEGNGKCEVFLPLKKVRDFCLKTKLCKLRQGGR